MGRFSRIGSAFKSGVNKVKKGAKAVKSVASKAVDAVDKITDNDFTEFALNTGGTLVGVPNAGTLARDSINSTQDVLDGDIKNIASKAIKQTDFKMPKSLTGGFDGIMNSVSKVQNVASNVKDTTAAANITSLPIQYKDVSNFINNNKSAFIASAVAASHATSWLSKHNPSELVKELFL